LGIFFGGGVGSSTVNMLVLLGGWTDAELVTNTNGVAWVECQHIHITTPNYDYLVVEAEGYTAGSAWGCDEGVKLRNDVTGDIGAIEYSGAGTIAPMFSNQQFKITRVLTAGVDYTKGTTFVAKLYCNDALGYNTNVHATHMAAYGVSTT
jgi:hypothetical protein